MARTRGLSRKDDIRDLNNTSVTRLADLNHDLRVRLIGESAARAEEDTPRFPNDLRTGRNLESVGDKVRASIDEDEAAARVLVEHSLESGGVVGLAVALRSLVAHADDLADGEVLVLRMRLAKDTASAVEEAAGLVGRGDVVLGEGAGRRGPGVNIALAPGIDRQSARGAREDSSAAGDRNSRRDVGEMDVVEDKGPGELAVGRRRGTDKDRRVGDIAVDQSNRAHSLFIHGDQYT